MNILAIGNSYTVDATHYLYKIAREQGVELDIYTLYIGGCSLEQHATNLKDNTLEYRLFHNGIDTALYFSIKKAILSRCWDVITIQQCSMTSYQKESYYPYITELTDFIRKQQPLAKYILHETWGYGDDSAPLMDRTEFKSFEEMSMAVAKTYREIYEEVGFDGFIPTGELLLNIYRRGITRLHRDGTHVSYGLGRFAAALMWYRCLTGRSVSDVTFNSFDERVTAEDAATAKEEVDSLDAIDGFFGITKRLGFGCMRMTMKDEEVDYDIFSEMIDSYINRGFNYFDTAHGYLNGKSEIALRECLVKRYPRNAFVLTNKLSHNFFEKEEDIRPFFEKQLEWCGVEYFDFYLMHAQTAALFEKYKRCRAYETALELKQEGKIKHFGISFHDTAEVLEEILTEYPEIEVVQIQFNYLDFDDASVQSRRVYEVCRKHKKAIIIMEPVKGGTLANLPDDARSVFDELGSRSPASYAIRFAAGFPGVVCVLSGMSTMEMLNDNISCTSGFVPLNDAEMEAVGKVRDIILSKKAVQCTDCRYCMEGCPQNIPIPSVFACLNSKKIFNNWSSDYYYSTVTKGKGRASDCIECGLCEDTCPQHLSIRELLKDASEIFDKKD